MVDAIVRLRDSIRSVYMGNHDAVDRLVCCLLARGHALIEDVPGVGKTVLATALARSIEGKFTRVQMTPDLLPSDVLGVSIFDRDRQDFVLRKGPIFTNILLADEINRTTPRTQTALLEAMNEAQISLDGQLLPLDQPFMVLATQNPYEFEGTYPLPENQLDRFLMRISLGYPSFDDEVRVLDQRPAQNALVGIEPIMHADDIVGFQRQVDDIRVDRALLEYVVQLATRSREAQQLRVGLSPRGSLALMQAARATAFYAGRDFVIPEDILDNVHAVCAHRMVTRGQASSPEAVGELLDSLVASLKSPA